MTTKQELSEQNKELAELALEVAELASSGAALVANAFGQYRLKVSEFLGKQGLVEEFAHEDGEVKAAIAKLKAIEEKIKAVVNNQDGYTTEEEEAGE